MPALSTVHLPAMNDAAMEAARRVEAWAREQPDQVWMATHHVIHGGMYARTVRIPAGVAIVGVTVKCTTLLVFAGCATVYIGDDTVEIEGYGVIPASAGRKQVFVARTDTFLTMLFPTEARTVEEAENEFTDAADTLMSRNGGHNEIVITGE
ncbi:MAG: hypothetical protein LBE50_03475 [Gallionellaceae bacterium]|nr:hypothetical protein [Gallionellaceae bacterium]